MTQTRISQSSAATWLSAHTGQNLHTEQTNSHTGRTWMPGPRILAARGKTFTLNGSRVTLETGAVCHLTARGLRIDSPAMGLTTDYYLN